MAIGHLTRAFITRYQCEGATALRSRDVNLIFLTGSSPFLLMVVVVGEEASTPGRVDGGDRMAELRSSQARSHAVGLVRPVSSSDNSPVLPVWGRFSVTRAADDQPTTSCPKSMMAAVVMYDVIRRSSIVALRLRLSLVFAAFGDSGAMAVIIDDASLHGTRCLAVAANQACVVDAGWIDLWSLDPTGRHVGVVY